MSASDSGVSDPDSSSVNDEASGVGLSDPQLSLERRKLLDSINRLRNTGVQADIDLPGIVVIGGQSAGKSSLIESISGITLPRAAGTCTRCPTECRLSRSDGPWTCTVELHYLKDQTGSALGHARTIVFGDPIFVKAQVEDRIRRAQRAILSPNKTPHGFLTDDATSPTELSFSTNYISLQISGPKEADLSFVDLPGLIASVSTKSGNEADIAMVENLVTSYISKPNCIILLTVACETDFENQGSHHLTKRHDPQGKRTIGVLTKPDRIPIGDEDSWLALIRNERDALENNWYCVKQPSSQDLKEGITWSSARAREEEFFSSKSPWAELDPVYQPYLGTANLVQRLSSILSDLISKRLPQIQVELELAIQQTRASLELLPPSPSDDAVLEITTLVHSFTRELDQMIEGVPHADGLIQTLRPAQEDFRRNIRRTAPDFRPFESGQSAQANRLMPPDPDFLREEEGREHWPNQSLSPARVPIFVNEVLTRAENARSRELPGHYPFAVQKAYIADFTRRWADPALVLCTSVHKTLSAQVTTLITNHFSAFGQGTLEDRVQVVVQAYIQELVTATQAAILKEIQHEENGPHTLNTHYLSDYKEKFITYYKQLRQKDRNPTLAAAIPSLHPQIEERAPSPAPCEAPYESSASSSYHPISPSSAAHAAYRPSVAFAAAPAARPQPVARSPVEVEVSRSPSVLISEVLRNLSALNLSIRAEDLMKLCPRDPMEPAFNIMADVRAYFQVAYKRVADSIPATIDDELVRGIGKNILPTLMNGLGLNGPEAIRIAKDFARENPATAKKRVELEKKLERLKSASQQLFAL